jgi:HIV Tat-specific factor 1
MILQDGNGDPRIKLYMDDKGKFKGEALVVFLQEESVGLAEQLMDDTELRLGEGGYRMVVKKAEWSHKAANDAEARTTEGPRGGGGGGGGRGRKNIDPEKQKAQRRAEKQKRYVSMPLSLFLFCFIIDRSRTNTPKRAFLPLLLSPIHQLPQRLAR